MDQIRREAVDVGQQVRPFEQVDVVPMRFGDDCGEFLLEPLAGPGLSVALDVTGAPEESERNDRRVRVGTRDRLHHGGSAVTERLGREPPDHVDGDRQRGDVPVVPVGDVVGVESSAV